MCCLLVILLLLGPRVAIVVWWLFEPLLWSATFPSFLVPFIGFLVLPWTTLVYVLVAPGGLNNFDYLWLALAVLVDLVSLAGGPARRRQRARAA
jgi:hypothetical protein